MGGWVDGKGGWVIHTALQCVWGAVEPSALPAASATGVQPQPVCYPYARHGGIISPTPRGVRHSGWMQEPLLVCRVSEGREGRGGTFHAAYAAIVGCVPCGDYGDTRLRDGMHPHGVKAYFIVLQEEGAGAAAQAPDTNRRARPFHRPWQRSPRVYAWPRA